MEGAVGSGNSEVDQMGQTEALRRREIETREGCIGESGDSGQETEPRRKHVLKQRILNEHDLDEGRRLSDLAGQAEGDLGPVSGIPVAPGIPRLRVREQPAGERDLRLDGLRLLGLELDRRLGDLGLRLFDLEWHELDLRRDGLVEPIGHRERICEDQVLALGPRVGGLRLVPIIGSPPQAWGTCISKSPPLF